MDATIDFDSAVIGDDPEAYLKQGESQVSKIVEGPQKEIVWAYPASRARTPLSIVYVHGFSASKGEVRPLPDIVARDLGANLFYTRRTGHGRDGPAMTTASVKAWANDFAEALAIGRAIGEEVIVVATSTGASLTIWAAANQPDLTGRVKGLVLLSPNVGVRATGAWLLTMPWGGVLPDSITGGTRGFITSSELQTSCWTESYPTSATLPMAAITTLAAASQVENIHVLALFMISDRDKVVRPDIMRRIAACWGRTA